MAAPISFWITIARGFFALILGSLLLFYPDQTRGMLVNFMGMYWLASGIVSLRWSMVDFGGRRMALIAGTIAILTGVGVLVRRLAQNMMPESTVLIVLGVVIVLTGLLHVFGGFRTREDHTREQSFASLVLGIFEIILGGLLIVSPLDRGPVMRLAVTIWALVGGIVLILDALAIRRAQLKQNQTVHPKI